MKRFKPMLCPICGGMYFSEPPEAEDLKEREEDIAAYLNGEVQCRHCGWIYDLDQAENPNSTDGYNNLSLNDYKKEYCEKIKQNPDYDYFEENRQPPEPRKCPVCGEYEFADESSFDICPICGWEDDGISEDFPDEFSPFGMTLNQWREWFKNKRKADPKYRWENDKDKENLPYFNGT